MDRLTSHLRCGLVFLGEIEADSAQEAIEKAADKFKVPPASPHPPDRAAIRILDHVLQPLRPAPPAKSLRVKQTNPLGTVSI